MKILIDIGHPAHVHYFKNLIRIMESKGHQFFIVSRDKEVALELLRIYKLDYRSRSTGGNSYIGKLFYLLKADSLILTCAIKFKPDLFLSCGSPYASTVSKILRKPHIAIDDTEHAMFERHFYSAFTDTILNPSAYYLDIGSKQIRFNGFMEQCYLHSNYFHPKMENIKSLGLKDGESYVFLRFISWKATHDIGHSGMSLSFKLALIKELLNHTKVFISSESDLPPQFQKYKLNTTPEKIHDVLAFAKMFIGEGATMASECAMLGTPAIYINSLSAGTLEEQERYGLVYGFRNSKGAMEKVFELLKNPNLHTEFIEKRNQMFNNKIDVTRFLVWFIENYPSSVKDMKENPDLQSEFK